MAGEYERIRSLADSGLTPQGYNQTSYKDGNDRRHNVLLSVKDGQLVDSNGNNWTQSYLDEEHTPTVTGIAPKNTSQYFDGTGALTFMGAALSPFNFLSPSNWVGTARRVKDEGLSYNNVMDSFMNGNNKGVVTENFHNEHPIWSMAANLGFDALTGAALNKAGSFGRTLPKTHKSGNLETGVPAGKYADFYLEGDPYEIYVQRAKAKGATDEQINSILQINYNTPEGKKKLAQRLYEIDKKAGQIADWEDPEAAKAKELKLFEDAIKEGTIDWDTKGTAIPDFKVIHYDSDQLPTMSDRSFVRLHEMEHAMHYPAKPVPKEAVDMSHFSLDPDYWKSDNNTEIGARISQVLSYMGIRDARKITGKELKKGFDYYAATHQHNNSISGLRRAVTNWDALAKWANDPANVFGTAATVGITLPAITNNK